MGEQFGDPVVVKILGCPEGTEVPFGSGLSNRGESTLLAGESNGDSVPVAVVSKGGSAALVLGIQQGRTAPFGTRFYEIMIKARACMIQEGCFSSDLRIFYLIPGTIIREISLSPLTIPLLYAII